MRNWKFTQLFKTDYPIEDEDLWPVVKAIKRAPKSANAFPAGYTYFGQFVAHDLTELRRGSKDPGRERVDVGELKQARKPALDLDSLYGAGLDDSVVTYEVDTGKFILGETAGGQSWDLFRRPDGTPLVADARNDENLLIAQMHVLFMHFHNRLVDHYERYEPGCKPSADKLFYLARKEAVLSYQWITLHDFANTLLPNKVYDQIIRRGHGKIMPRDRKSPVMSIEFAGAAFRMGHSMVRNTYALNSSAPSVSLADLFNLTGKGVLSHSHRLPDKMIVDWKRFFHFTNYEAWCGRPAPAVNQTKRIDTGIESGMQTLPRCCGSGDIVDLNLRRGRELGLATGQEVCKQLLQDHEEVSERIGLSVMTASRFFDRLPENSKFKSETPLWAYVLSEAREFAADSGKSLLGNMGGWLVADGLLAAAHYADVRVTDDRWTPRDSVINKTLGGRKPAGSQDDLSLEDLIVFTYLDDQ